MKAVVHVDGASRGNPGHASCAAIIEIEGKPQKELGVYLGATTNNVAEYCGFILALLQVKALGAEEIEILSDSKLCVEQVNGGFKVTAEHIKPLHKKVLGLLNQFKKWKVSLIPREENEHADRLSNEVLSLHKVLEEK